jgi:hypothetical protein
MLGVDPRRYFSISETKPLELIVHSLHELVTEMVMPYAFCLSLYILGLMG